MSQTINTIVEFKVSCSSHSHLRLILIGVFHVVNDVDEKVEKILWKIHQCVHTGEKSKQVRFLKYHENVPVHVIFVKNTGNRTLTEKGDLVIYQRVYTGNKNQWQLYI